MLVRERASVLPPEPDPNRPGKRYQDYIPIEKLFVDTQWQRDYDERWARWIADHWDENGCGLLYVAKRGERFVVIDGQHRLGAAAMRGEPYLPCWIYEGFAPEYEAHLFEAFNKRRKPVDIVALFKNAVFRGDREAVSIKGIVEELGMSIPEHLTRAVDGQIIAIGALQYVYRSHSASHLRLTLKILQEVWDQDQTAYQAVPIRGLSTFLSRYREQYDERLLISRLRVHSPGSIRRNATNLADITTVHPETAWAQTALAIYNKGLTTRRLAEWVARVRVSKPRQDGTTDRTGIRRAIS